MKRKSFGALLLLAATLNCYSLINAEIQTYTDQCLSFQYDDEMHGTITKNFAFAGGVYYNLETADTQSGVAILPLPEGGIDAVICDDETEYSKQVKISDTEVESYYPETGITYRLKIVATNESQYAYVSYNVDKVSEVGQAFIDSVQVDDSFKDGYVFEESKDNMIPTKIFRNKCYSDQAIVYANQALGICNQYLAFEIDGKEACSEMEILEKRVESYMESTDNAYDSDVKYAIFLLNLKLSMNNDSDVIAKRDELQAIVDAGAE